MADTNTGISFFRSLRGQLILLFLIVSLIPLITISWLAYTHAKDALKTEVINKLIAVRDLKVNRIVEYFAERQSDLKVLAQNPFTIAASKAFEKAIHTDMVDLGMDETGVMKTRYRPQYLGQSDLFNADDGSAYSATHAQYHPIFKAYQKAYDYYDIFLVELHSGNILYSVEKENDFGTSLLNGTYANSSLGQLFQKTRQALNSDSTWIQDFAYYKPSQEPALFVAAPIFEHSKIIGVLVFQLSTTQINKIMQERTGLGQTGETILVSSEDFLLRSDSHFFKERTLLKQKIDTEAAQASALGLTGLKEIIDYRGEPTLIAHTPLSLPGIRWSLNAKMDQTEAFAAAHQMLRWILLTVGLGIVLVISIALFFSNSITKPIRNMTQIARQLAKGQMNLTIEVKNQDEVGMMAQAFRQMIFNTHQVIEDIVQLSQGIAAGNLDVTPQMEYQGDFIHIKKALENAFSELRLVIQDIEHVSQELAEGHWEVTPQIEYRGDFGQIKQALESTAAKLAKATVKNTEQHWLKTGQTQLNDLLSGEREILPIAEKAINFLTPYVDAQLGAIYFFEAELGHLNLVASHAYMWRNTTINQFKLGEGIVGQAALEQKTVIIAGPPSDYILVQSGLGQATPKALLVMPFLYENTLKGVIELASFNLFTDIQIEFLRQIMPNLATTVHAAQSRQQLQALLEQTQQQSEELQNKTLELEEQQAALQQSNEELQSQSEELQAQQEELRYFNEELEERTHELEKQRNEISKNNLALEKNQQLLEAKADELEQASQYKSEFLANMSHELRTPLNSLLILAQLLTENKEQTLSTKQIEYARTIYNAGSDLLALINDILDLSKVEAGKMEIHPHDLFLAEFVGKIERKFRYLAEQKDFVFTLNIADKVPSFLHTDEQRLSQIINNLLSNAFKFTQQGKIALDICVVSEKSSLPSFLQKKGEGESLEPRHIIAINVSDTGIGIPKPQQQSIFEAFQQADGTTSRRYGGTGLGLSISRQLAHLLGGELVLESEEGQGSTFTLYLPTTSASDLSEKAKILPQATAETPSQPVFQPLPSDIESKPSDEDNQNQPPKVPLDDRKNLKLEDKSLLIIEDDRQFAKIVMELAHENGFKCLLAEEGKNGLQLVEQYQPNAIILDVGLPQLDGWSVMERLKSNAKTRHIPVHFMSAYDHSHEAKRKGAIGYLHKPASMEDLTKAFKVIEQFLGNNLKHILVIADDEARQQKIVEVVEDGEVKSAIVTCCETVYQNLHSFQFNCIILDVDCGAGAGIEFLEEFQQDNEFTHIPVLVYAERDLTSQEETLLRQYSNHHTVKVVNSLERLLDETTLFLHQLETNLPAHKRKMLKMVHDKNSILKQQKILIVDDDMRNVFSLASVLEDHGMEVIPANNGHEALEKLKTHQNIAIVLMDIMMPEMDGYQTMQEIRKQPQYHKLPIIALTAKAMKGDKAKCIEAGANDYLSKPVDSEQLLSLMRVWLYQ
jgi:signal transduction histidine kinase/CheY-like chemotaxis protein